MEYLIPPWEHQRVCIERARTLPEFALFFEMGAGKTMTTINILRHKYQEHRRVLRTLILCPIIVVENWRREFAMHSKIAASVTPLLGASKLKRLEKAAEIRVTNFESLQNKDFFAALSAWSPEVLVVDESQRVKNPSAVRTKLTTALSDLTHYRFILSGTPILNSPMDIYAQYRILDRGATFGTNFYTFRAKYFWDKNAGMPKQSYFPNWIPKASCAKELQEKIYVKAMRVEKKDCLDLPPFTRQRVDVELSPDQERHYNEMKKDFVSYCQGSACVAELAITKALRLQQIVSGYMKLENGEEVALKSTPRMTALSELLSDLTPDHKVIVWATFQENYRQIFRVLQGLGIKYAELHGGIPAGRKQENVDLFNTDPTVRAMVANQGAGGVGVNLVAASYSIFYSRNFSLEADLQAEARNYRGGSEIHEKVTRIDLVAAGTIDELVVEALGRKQDIARAILELPAKL